MTEQDGHEMLVARAKALEEIALHLVLGTQNMMGRNADPEKAKAFIEDQVETIAPGCGHVTRH